MLLGDLLRTIPDVEVQGIPRIPVTGVTHDSRRVRAGNLFVGVRGEKSDGAGFFKDAVKRGAVALAAEGSVPAIAGVATLRVRDARRFLAQAARALYMDPTSRLKLVGITGTNGKTTTSFLVDAIFKHAGVSSCLAGTTGMKIRDDWRPTDRTTPEAPDLMLFLHEAESAGCTHGVMEVSSHALALKRVFGFGFAAGVFTNLTPDHLDFHLDMESYYGAKRLLFAPEGENHVGTAVINIDDPYGLRLASEVPCPVLSYGFGEGADIRLIDCRLGPRGTDLVVGGRRPGFKLHSPLVGRPNAYNVLAAVAAALSLELSEDAIIRGIDSLGGVPGRMERVDVGQPYLVVVDYAHTPDALEKLLETVRGLPHRRLITVFGCGGDRDRSKRPSMGEIAARLSDRVIATSDNPRSEDPLSILAEIESGLKKGPARYEIAPDRRQAILAAVEGAGEGDAVVIAGKGHETHQIIGAQAFPFDDRAVARELILERLRKKGANS